MSELQAFFHMGGYAWYVWPAFLLTFVVLLANVLISAVQLKQARLRAVRRAAERPRRRNQTGHTTDTTQGDVAGNTAAE